jgi:hypothetical protein
MDFDEALAAYRCDPIRASERSPYRTPPVVQQLIFYSEKLRKLSYSKYDLPSPRVELRTLIGKAEMYWRLCLDDSPLFGPGAEPARKIKIAQKVQDLRQEYIQKFGEPCRTWLEPEINQQLDETLAQCELESIPF